MPPTIFTYTLERQGRNHCFGALLVAAVFSYAGLPVPAVVMALFAVFLVGYSTQWQLDTRSCQYRHGGNLFGLHMGSDWHPMPKVQRVVVRYFSDVAVSNDDSWDGVEIARDHRYIVLLSVPESSQGLIVAQVPQQQQALRLGRQLGQALAVDVLECDQHGELRMLQEADPTDAMPEKATPHFEPAPSSEA